MAVTEEELPWTLGERIRKARRAAHLEQDELANRLGVSRPLVSRWENDHTTPTAKQLAEIVNATGAKWLLRLELSQFPCIDVLAGRTLATV